MGRVWKMVRPQWKRCCVVFCLLCSGIILSLIPPRLTRTLVDDVLNPEGGHPGWLVPLVLSLVGMGLCGVALTVLSNRLTTAMGSRLTQSLRETLFRRLQELSVRFYDRSLVGSLITRVSSDTEEVQTFFTQATMVMRNLLMIVGIGVMLFTMNWRLALVVLLPAPLVMAATSAFRKYYIPILRRYWFTRRRMNGFLGGCLSGIRVVKAFAQEMREVSRFQTRNRNLYTSRLDMDRAVSTFYPPVVFLFQVGGILMWYVGGRLVMREQISLGTLMAFLSYVGMFYAPLSSLTQLSNWLTRFLTSVQQIFEILDTDPEITDVEEATELPTAEGRIDFENVTFGYDRWNPVLHNVSFRVEPGEFIGIVGPSGAGKSTVVNLMCRFYDTCEGTIRIDGTDVRKIRKTDLRRQIGLVLQEPYLFRGTIAENIAYGKPEASREQIIQAAMAANAHNFISQSPEGYDTRVGDRGAGLSGGEKQRISIARAILHDPRILILDEATSSVDTDTERQIQKALDTLVENRTTFAIAHRLSTLQNADRIMVVNHGMIEEFGTHQELMKNTEGTYYRLVSTQYESDLRHQKTIQGLLSESSETPGEKVESCVP
jgi:ATP-binding cassette subfamily B protein